MSVRACVRVCVCVGLCVLVLVVAPSLYVGVVLAKPTMVIPVLQAPDVFWDAFAPIHTRPMYTVQALIGLELKGFLVKP